MFKQHPRRLYTWTSPDGNIRNQINSLHFNCAKMENKLDEVSQVSGSRLRHRSVARGYAESQAGKKTKTAQHSASESPGTQGRQNSTVCSRGDLLVVNEGEGHSSVANWFIVSVSWLDHESTTSIKFGSTQWLDLSTETR